MVDLVPDRSNGSKKTSDNKRRGAPKVRTGCKTCKYVTRRVKCDEGKPECLRCTRAGYDCGGYGTTGVPCRRTRNLLLPKSYEISSAQQRNIVQFPRTGVYIQPSSTPRFDTDIQREHFMFFQTRTAPELAGYFDSTVWNRKILQACHDQEYARHAVVALGALWKALDITQTIRLRNSSGVRKTQEATEFYAFALREYGKALHLMKNIPSQPYPDRLRNTLMSSLLTTCFESYIGNQELALSQAEIGIDTLLDYTNECQKTAVDDWTTMKSLENRSKFLDDDIVGMFARMDLQVMTFRDRNRTRYRTKAFPKVPVLFTSTNEARLYWDLIVRRVFVWHAQAHRDGSVPLDFAYSKEDKDGDIGSKEKKIADEAAEEARAFQKVTKDWYQAFLPMFERTRHCPGTKDHLAASSLMLRFIRSRANLTSDPLDYVRLVDLAREILENDVRSSTGKAVFTFETTVLVGLLIVVTACPQVAPRLQAIELCLKYPRREGLVDSQMVMTIARWMLEQEENEVDGAIPEQSKLHIVKNEFDLKERRAVLHCAKGNDKIPLPPVTLYW